MSRQRSAAARSRSAAEAPMDERLDADGEALGRLWFERAEGQGNEEQSAACLCRPPAAADARAGPAASAPKGRRLCEAGRKVAVRKGRRHLVLSHPMSRTDL